MPDSIASIATELFDRLPPGGSKSASRTSPGAILVPWVCTGRSNRSVSENP